MIGAHASANRTRGWLVTAARWGAALLVLGLLVRFVPFEQLRQAIHRVPFTRFLIVLIAYLAAHAVSIAKWRMVVNAAGARLDFATCGQCYTGGLFATLFLPSIIGGDVVRLAVGLRRSPNPAAVLAGNVADRFLDVCAQAGLVMAGLLLLPNSLPSQFATLGRRALLFLLIGGLLAALLLAIFYRPLFQGRSIRFRRRLARLRYALRSVSKKPHILFAGWLLGTGIQLTFLILTALLAVSCGLFLPLKVWLFAWPLAKLAALLPLTQGGIGVREAALVLLLSPFGAPGQLVLAAGLVWEGIVIAGGLIAGFVAFLLNRFTKTQPKQ